MPIPQAPLFLAAALAAVIPVIIHMINRQKAKDLPFSTLRFLRISVEKTRRRRRIHDVLLMLLRMAALVLIALGLADMRVTSLNWLWGGGARSAVVIVLDDSASMGTTDRGGPRIQAAMDGARQILAELEDDDQIALLVANQRTPAEPPEPAADAETEPTPETEKGFAENKEAILEQLTNTSADYQRADLASQLRQARKMLAKSKASNKLIYVLTDQQRLSWEGLEREKETSDGQPAEEKNEEDKDGRNIPIVFVNYNREPQPDVAVKDVELEIPAARTGVTMWATVTLWNTSTVEQPRRVQLFVDGEKTVDSPQATVSPWDDDNERGEAKIRFAFDFQRGGLHRCEVRLVGEDGLAVDDSRFFAMQIDPGIPIAIVKQRRHEIDYLDDSHYLETALAPPDGSNQAVQATVLTADQLFDEPLSGYQAVFCVNLSPLGASTAEKLHSYVLGGGNVIWICGDNVDPGAYNQMNAGGGGELLPAPLLDVSTPDPADNIGAWNLTYLNADNPALAPLTEPASVVNSVLVYKHVSLDMNEASGATVLARMSNDQPFLIQRSVGEGTVTMLTTGVHLQWTNFPLRQLFLPLWSRLIYQFAGAEQTRYQTLAGAPLVIPLEEPNRPTRVRVTLPGGQTRLIDVSADAAGNPPDEFRFTETQQLGVYKLEFIGAAEPEVHPFAVNYDWEESSPDTIPPEELEERFAGTPIEFAEDPEDLSKTFDKLREGDSLWERFLWLVLAALVFETFLANRLSRKKEEAEGDQPPPGMRRLGKGRRSAA